MRRAKSEPISNFALGGVLAVALITVGVLGGLFYKLHARSRGVEQAQAPVAPIVVPSSGVQALKQQAELPLVEKHDALSEDSPVIRVVARSGDEAAIQSAEAASPPVAAAGETRVSVPAAFEAQPTHAEAVSPEPKTSGAKDSNELIPDINGPSYTAKKAMSNAADPRQPTRPAAKKPEPKKPVPPPPPPKTPAEVEPPKPPAAPPIDPKKAPVYVLNDGRRIRAISIHENGGVITLTNEAGSLITFKTSDVKQIVRN